ncbi:MAG: ribosome small subunit-dependent GTPase A [Candidatus Latescibacterota bacterium]|nr:ribosome small subunit-dependent GTPase A [Candidatus Latescibacterota bacterium]
MARVMRVSGSTVVVDIAGHDLLCDLRGKLKQGRRRTTTPIVAGDWVHVDSSSVEEGDRGVVEQVLSRNSRLSRSATGERPLEQIFAANVDRFIAVVAAREPALRPGFIDRTLVMALSGGVEPMICINKIDLDPESMSRGEIVDIYRDLGYRVLETSAETGEGIPAFAEHLHQGVSALIGPSGVGKSSLLNAVQPGLGIATQQLMRNHDRGRHTTTAVQLHRIGVGGFVADTPGIKQLQPWGVTRERLVEFFPEMTSHTGHCHYRDCSHLHEPGCGVREAAANGEISELRYEGFFRIAENLPKQEIEP